MEFSGDLCGVITKSLPLVDLSDVCRPPDMMDIVKW